MGDATLNRPARRDERLGGDEAAENPRAAIVGTESAKKIDVERLQVEPREKAFEI
jgi:hypothetical protein